MRQIGCVVILLAQVFSGGSLNPSGGTQGFGTVPNPVSLNQPINGVTAYGDANASNKLLSWINPSGDNSFYQYMNSIRYWTVNNIPTCGGEPGYYYYPFLTGGSCGSYQVQPADTAAMCVQAALAYNTAFSDTSMISPCVTYLQYVMAHETNGSWTIPNMPFAASHAAGGNPPYDGYEPWLSNGTDTPTADLIEPSKLASCALAMLALYNYNSTTYASMLTSAEAIADELVTLRQTSTSSTVSPWPFRINADTGATTYALTGEVTNECRLFQQLIALSAPHSSNYTTALNAADTWLVTYVIGSSVWTNYYEDQGANTNNRQNFIILEAASYVLDYPSADASYCTDAESLVSSAATQLGGTDIGSSTWMAEQNQYQFPTADATTRWALVNLKLWHTCSQTADLDVAFRALNWVTYGLLATSGANEGLVYSGWGPSVAISNISNSSGMTITITTSSAITLNPTVSGGGPIITGVTGQTAINGTWGSNITQIDSTHFTLGTYLLGNGVASSGGFAALTLPVEWYRVSWETVLHMCQAIAIYPAWGNKT